MNRLQEVEHKHNLVKGIMEKNRADALWIRRTRNLAWITAGADASIPADSDYGVYSVLITPKQRIIYTNNIEITRLRAEENFEALGFDFAEFQWYTSMMPDYPRLFADEGSMEQDMQRLRWVLLEPEKERYRQLGKDIAAAIEAAARAVQKGDTEFEIAARLDAECRKRGALAVVNLVAVDERIANFRHPLPTFKKLEKVAMLVVCARRNGLIVAATRFAVCGNVPDGLNEKIQKIAAIDAAAIVASRPGRTLGEVFADIQAAYAAQGEADQWKLHHQGGLTGYAARERIATPDDPTVLQANQALAWNPSIVGAKSEDTILIDDKGFEIVTAGDFPKVKVEVGGQVIERPAAIEV